MSTSADFRNQIKPNWCPGCGHYALQNALQQAAAHANIEPHQLAVISGIGCSGRLSGYMYAYGVHGIHGRALPIAQGVKMGNRDLTVVACGGDGDGFAIGLGHTIHAMKRNMDITYIVLDNHVYGLTKGQTSPRSDLGFQTKTTPNGATESPISAIELALASGASFVAQGFSQNIKELTSLVEQGIRHKGFSFINVFSPCVTFNKVNTYEWYKNHLTSLQDIHNYDSMNRSQAMEVSMAHDGLITGLIYRNKEKRSYQTTIDVNKQPLAQLNRTPDKEILEKLISEFI
ncbi:2-oxoacid:ferredoxin oxidoreductase subunit beta [Pelosinus sp. sgz500959]|uniref:2-oxoacid:ferredoxin oxidoreductase subunit beta n=1 Tax=Pelosinus sp. sgz500959 TaxID=3242472 RepID=UPI00366EEE67